MTNEEIKQAWNEAITANGGALLNEGMGGLSNMVCMWNGFVMAHGRADLFGYANYQHVVNPNNYQIWERKDVSVGER